MKISIMAVSVVATCVLCPLHGASDAEITAMMLRSTRVIDNEEMADRMVRRAEVMCEHDTNRLVRLVHELAQTNDSRIAHQMLQLLGDYGDSGQLPFLRTASTNNIAGMSAMTSILKISGVCATSLSDLSVFLRAGRTDGVEKTIVCWSYSNWSKRPGVSQAMRDGLREILMSYGTSNTDVAVAFDDLMCNIDESYKNSQRRLRTLRSADQPGLSPFQAGHVTNAINRLIAYPEANLPE